MGSLFFGLSPTRAFAVENSTSITFIQTKTFQDVLRSVSPCDRCGRCGQAPASLSHTFWNCPNIIPYWTKIIDTLSEILKVRLPLDPVMSLFGVVPIDLSPNSSQINVICFVLLMARRLILLNWKNKSPSSHQTPLEI